jgi:hypothetical protein
MDLEATPERIAKLPKWAQEHLASLTRDRDTLHRALQSYLDVQYDRFYIQDEQVTFEHAGVRLQVNAYREGEIALTWGPAGSMAGLGDLCFIPTSYQRAKITNMAYTPREYQRLQEGREREERREREEA